MRRLTAAIRSMVTRTPAPKGGGRKLTRRKPWTRTSRLAMIWGSAAAALALAATGVAWLVRDGWVDRQVASLDRGFVATSAQLGFTVDRVLADGRNETTSSQVLSAVGVQLGEPIFSVDLEAARARLLTLPWVATATIERRLPDTLYVRITETTPLALWQQQQKLHLLGGDGRVIADAPIERFADLLVVVGPDAPEHAGELLDMMATQPELRRRVTAAVRIGGRRWNLRIDNGIDVKLPEQNGAAAWAELGRLERDYGILGRDLTVIDLRLPNQLQVQLAPTAVARQKAKGDDT
ncbi:MAG TPA: FtsQ-type POTRA domain-containing protein [Candidatus Acidoferrum sp.]|nr:FtsQ-type POTRA domain-containing protein [Candidatus Acidoferrum sp.]